MPAETEFPIPLRGHRDAFERLRGTVARGRLAHAYLFVGPPGVGKKRFAFGIAQCLLCENRREDELTACGQCPGCKQVLARTHPDLLTLSRPEGKSQIPVALVTGDPKGTNGLLHDVSLRPMAGGRRIAIIDDAESLNVEGSNALLKTLEEPPPASVLILIAPSADSMLPTIRSRCQVLRFSPLTETDVTELLLEQGLTENPAEAAEVAAMSQGSLETAGQLLDPKLREVRKQLFDGLAGHPYRAPQLAAKMNAAIEDAGTERPLKLRQARWLVQFCVEFYRQVLRHLSDSPSTGDIPQVAALASRLPRTKETIDAVADALDRCFAAQYQLEGNVTIPLCMETLFDDCGRILRGA